MTSCRAADSNRYSFRTKQRNTISRFCIQIIKPPVLCSGIRRLSRLLRQHRLTRRSQPDSRTAGKSPWWRRNSLRSKTNSQLGGGRVGDYLTRRNANRDKISILLMLCGGSGPGLRGANLPPSRKHPLDLPVRSKTKSSCCKQNITCESKAVFWILS